MGWAGRWAGGWAEKDGINPIVEPEQGWLESPRSAKAVHDL